ncbi:MULTISPECIES: flagellar assembly protein FliX [unclassified Brevundimonas]|uniref:flagellar assembly protein FliX n=1 Tax=unclassified Brevundimonas TaxID=2622653 RepID=UPI003F8F941D
MKVTGPSGPTSTQGQRPARAAGGFSLPAGGAASGPASANATSSASSVAGVSALMALQGVEDATERRRRAIRRGGGLLDRLDELKLALLNGQDGAAALERLARTLREERPEDADPGLKGVLDQIDLRAAVEMAKAETARAAV